VRLLHKLHDERKYASLVAAQQHRARHAAVDHVAADPVEGVEAAAQVHRPVGRRLPAQIQACAHRGGDVAHAQELIALGLATPAIEAQCQVHPQVLALDDQRVQAAFDVVLRLGREAARA
jgi:hypothetical protein